HALPSKLRIYAAPEGEPASARVERAAVKLVHRVAPRRKAESRGSLGREELARSFNARSLIRAHGAWISVASEKIWAREAARRGVALARQHRYDAVASSGPPHMAHYAAGRVANA